MFIYPENLKAKPMLWLWLLRDIAVIGIGIGALLSVLALTQGLGMGLLVVTVLYAFLTIQVVRREGFEPPAFWSVGCLKGKSEPFRLRFVLFATVRSADFPLFPSSPARSNSILGQNWVKHGVPAPTPTVPRSPSHRRRQPDRPR